MTATKLLGLFWRRQIAAVSIVALVLQGCMGTVGIILDDKADACYEHRYVLHTTQQAFDTETQKWVIGGMASAMVAAATAMILTGGSDWRAFVAAAAAGAVGGYIVAVHRHGMTQDDLARVVNADAAKGRAQLTSAAAAMRALADCRTREITALRRETEAGRMSEAAGRDGIAAIRSKIDADQRLVDRLLGDAAKQVDVFAGGLAVAKEVEQESLLDTVAAYVPQLTDLAARAPTTAQAANARTMQARTGVNVRTAPTTSSRVVGTLAPGQRVEALGLSPDQRWYIVDFARDRRYVHRDYLVPPGSTALAAAGGVDTTRRPPTTNEIERLAVTQKEVQVEATARFDTLAADLEALDVLLS